MFVCSAKRMRNLFSEYLIKSLDSEFDPLSKAALAVVRRYAVWLLPFYRTLSENCKKAKENDEADEEDDDAEEEDERNEYGVDRRRRMQQLLFHSEVPVRLRRLMKAQFHVLPPDRKAEPFFNALGSVLRLVKTTAIDNQLRDRLNNELRSFGAAEAEANAAQAMYRLHLSYKIQKSLAGGSLRGDILLMFSPLPKTSF